VSREGLDELKNSPSDQEDPHLQHNLEFEVPSNSRVNNNQPPV